MKTVLLVDTEPGSSSLSEALQRRGFLWLSATNAHEALAMIDRDPSIALVITEMQFPDMDGLHFLINLRAKAPDLPIIVVTDSGSIENYLHAVNLGVYEYLNKPVPPKELVRIASIALAGPWTVPPLREASRSAGRTTDPALLFQGGTTNASDR
jgi:DNA-binding NtrC family response regulator